MDCRKSIKEMIKILRDKYKPKKIILFGSYAYGKPQEDSDVDLLIIKDTNKRPIDRWLEAKKILRDFTRTIPVSPLVYTQAEIKERLAMKDFFIKDILKRGKVMYG
jgi:predicted nucleotidyltransferase